MNMPRQWPIRYGNDMETQLAGPYVIGVDAGGTTTRCVVMAPSGTIAGYGRGPGANRNSGGDAVTSLTTALRAALRDLDTSLVAGGVFGIAGAGAAGRAGAVHAATEAWRACGLAGAPSVVTDISVAFAAGTNAATGIVVFSGTGAGAAVISHGNIVRRADGYGWLVGDEGSAVRRCARPSTPTTAGAPRRFWPRWCRRRCSARRCANTKTRRRSPRPAPPARRARRPCPPPFPRPPPFPCRSR
jgi:glucosamine kinase